MQTGTLEIEKGIVKKFELSEGVGQTLTDCTEADALAILALNDWEDYERDGNTIKVRKREKRGYPRIYKSELR